jgi:hypothetical protein
MHPKPLRLFFAALLLVPSMMFASSHREAPLITEDPTMDNTDVYVFRSPDAPVVLRSHSRVTRPQLKGESLQVLEPT